jgi:hypothetical protein
MEREPLVLYTSPEAKEGSDKKPYRLECGTLWPHKTGEGYDLVVAPGLSVSGRCVAFPRKPKEQPPQE